MCLIVRLWPNMTSDVRPATNLYRYTTASAASCADTVLSRANGYRYRASRANRSSIHITTRIPVRTIRESRHLNRNLSIFANFCCILFFEPSRDIRVDGTFSFSHRLSKLTMIHSFQPAKSEEGTLFLAFSPPRWVSFVLVR
jgi:hypothetical protein